MAREQVTPDLPHTTFSVRILKVGVETWVPQSSCTEGGAKRGLYRPAPFPSPPQVPQGSAPLTVTRMYSQSPSKTKRCPSKVTTWPSL